MSSSVTSPSGVRPSNVAALTVRLRSVTGPERGRREDVGRCVGGHGAD